MIEQFKNVPVVFLQAIVIFLEYLVEMVMKKIFKLCYNFQKIALS